MNPVEDSASEALDLQQVPPMETVFSDDGLDNLESDDDSNTGISEDSAPTSHTVAPTLAKPESATNRPFPATNPNSEVPRATRRTRGMSFLPVRQSTNAIQQQQLTSPAGSMSPPTTPSPLRPFSYSQQSSGTRRSSVESNGQSSGNRSQPSTPTTTTDNNSSLLAAYMNQLAAKEARVVDLRNTINRLQQEMKDAESDLAAYKDNGKKLAQLVNLPEGGRLGVKGGPGDSQKDVLGMGRRVVDEIGTQFWSFLEDVKSATMGSADFPGDGSSQQPGFAQRIPEPIPRSPSPQRQLSPKRSIQDFLKSRSHSPIRRSRSPMSSPERQQKAEQHASQRLRESERLTKKLSHIDLRAPSPTRAPPGGYNEAF